MRPRLAALGLVLALALTGGPAAAWAATPRASFTDVEHDVMCVVCGVPLDVAEAPEADQERALIRRLIARGETKGQIEDTLVAQYGRNVLATPPQGGFDLAVWAVPIAVVVVVAAALAVVARRWRRRSAGGTVAGSGPAPRLSSADALRLDEDLARFDG